MRRVPSSAIATVQWWVLVATVVSTPLVYSRWTFDVFNVTEATLLRLGVAVGLSLQLALRTTGWRLPLPKIWPLVAAYVGVVVLATAWSRAPWVSLMGVYGRLGGLATLIPAVLAAWLLYGHLVSRPHRRGQLLGAIGVSAAIGGIYLVGQQLDLDSIVWLEGDGQTPEHPPGLLGNSNFSGAHVAMGVAPLAWKTATARGRWRYVWFAGGVVSLLGVAISQSRGAMIAAVAGLVVLVAASPRRPRWLPVAAATTVALVVGVALVAGDGLDDLTDSTTSGERIDLWEIALRGVGDNPILGGGPDLYVLTFDEHAGPELSGVSADEPHNVLLDHLDGAGLLGAAAWLLLVAGLIHAALTSGRLSRTAPWLGMGAAYLAQAMVSIDVVPLLLWGWVAASGILGATAARRPTRWAERAPNSSVGVGVLASVSVVAAIGALVVLQPFFADMAYRRGVEAANAGDNSTAVYQFAQAADRHPWEPRYHRRLGAQLQRAAVAGDPTAAAEARRAFEDGLRLFPQDPDAARWLAELDEQLGSSG